MEVDALIQAAGSGHRLGLGPKAFVMLGGKTLLEHAVDTVSPFAKRVLIAIRPDDLVRAKNLIKINNVEWVEGAESRSSTTRRLVYASNATWVILHDTVHPLVKPQLVQEILDMAFKTGLAAPGVLNTDFLYNLHGKPSHSPGELIVGQKPVAFNRLAAIQAYEEFNKSFKQQDPSLLEVLEYIGQKANFVKGDPTNIKITTPGDLELANALMNLRNVQ